MLLAVVPLYCHARVRIRVRVGAGTRYKGYDRKGIYEGRYG